MPGDSWHGATGFVSCVYPPDTGSTNISVFMEDGPSEGWNVHFKPEHLERI